MRLSLEEEMTKNPSEMEKTYHLPGGHEIMVQNQRFRCPGTLFHLPNVGIESPGTDKLCSNSVTNDSSSGCWHKDLLPLQSFLVISASSLELS